MLAEAAFGFAANSVALLADAGHNLGDVLALLAAWAASRLAGAPPSTRYTYGLKATSIWAALFNAVALMVVTGGIAWESIRRLFEPASAHAATVMAVAAAGIAVNGFTAWLLSREWREDLNARAALAHMLADAAIAAGVVVAGALMLLTGQGWIDPLASLAISAIVVWGAWSLLRESADMALAAAPPGIDPLAVAAFLERLDGVAAIHDLHIWPLSTTETALTCHLVTPAGAPGDAFLRETCAELKRRFRIGHATLQVETSVEADCPLEPAHVV